MGISYRKLRNLLKERHITSYTLVKKEKLIGQSGWTRIHSDASMDTATIGKLCKYLNVQPGDIMEYLPDDE